MGRHKNTDGTFVPVGLKIRFEILNRLYQSFSVPVKIPSARELATQYHLSPSTVKLELQKLIREGYLVGRHGSGTYTNPEKVKFIPGALGRKIVGILVRDGRLLIYDAIDWAAQSWCGMALSPDVAHPRFVTLLSSTGDQVYEELMLQNLSGLIWVHPDAGHREKVIRRLNRNGLPTVAVKSESADYASVDYSFFRTGQKLAEQIAREKRKSIFYVPTNNDYWTLQRIAGIRDHIARHPETGMTLRVFDSTLTCTEELEHCFAAGEIPDAMYCNGVYAYVVLELARKYRIDIVERCRLFAERQHVDKCSAYHGYVLDYPFPEIGKAAAEMMRILLEDPHARIPVRHVVPEVRFQEGKELFST